MILATPRMAAIDDILERWRAPLAHDFNGYRNHCCRVLSFCLALSGRNAGAVEKFAIAAAFHDLGIWTHHTFDYIGPSRTLARDYLAETNRSHWAAEIETMIEQHHKMTAYTANPQWLVEPFRKADWVDVSKGLLKFGLPLALVHRVMAEFPNMRFHQRLVVLGWRRFKTHPRSPLPMMRL